MIGARYRNTVLLALLFAFGLMSTVQASAKLPPPVMAADGMYTEAWFNTPNYDLRKDLAAAKKKGQEKILILISSIKAWEDNVIG